MALTPDQLDDFVKMTLKRFKKRRWVDISLDHQEYFAMSRLFKKKKVQERGGEQISWRVQVRNGDNARNTGMFAVDQTSVIDVMEEANLPWRKQTTNFSYDVDEVNFQSGPETIIKELKVREHQAMNNMAELFEENLWNAPTSPSDNRPHGIPFWLQKNATEGFNGGNPSGFSAGAGGLNSDTYPNWRNYTFAYTQVSRDDLVEKWRKACAFTRFMAPHSYPELKEGDRKHEFFTTYRVLAPLEKLLENRNDNLGNDLAKYAGAVMFKSNPIHWVPYLETNDTSDPVYGVNWEVFRPYVKSGRDMVRHPPKQAAHQHTVREVFIDCWSNYICYNRRLTFVGYVA